MNDFFWETLPARFVHRNEKSERVGEEKSAPLGGRECVARLRGARISGDNDKDQSETPRNESTQKSTVGAGCRAREGLFEFRASES